MNIKLSGLIQSFWRDPFPVCATQHNIHKVRCTEVMYQLAFSLRPNKSGHITEFPHKFGV